MPNKLLVGIVAVHIGSLSISLPPTDNTQQHASVAADDSSTLRRASRHDGLVLPTKRVALRAAVESRVMNTAVKEGQTVEEGDILIQLDDRRQRTATDIAVMASESDVSVEAAEMSSEQAQIDLENAEAAFKANAGSEWEFRRAILERNLSVLRIAAAQLEHQSATLNAQVEKIRLAEYQVRAPFPGYINRVLVDPGSRVTGETEIIEIVDLRTLQAEIMLPVSLYNTVTIGDTYQLTGDVPVSRELQGTLVHASRVIDPASETFRCVFQIENNDNSLPSGFRIWFDAER